MPERLDADREPDSDPPRPRVACTVRELHVLTHMPGYLEELLGATRKLGPLYSLDPKLVADITRKGKMLRTALEKFRERCAECVPELWR